MSERPSPIAPETAGDCHAEWKQAAAVPTEPVDLAVVRERLASSRGPRFWSGLEQVAGTPHFEAMLHREFPRFAAEWPAGVSRRNFLRLSAASLGLAGLTACTRQPLEKIVPYVKQPEEILPGRPLFFATAAVLGGYATGILAESHEGRPTKVEGNPEHPASLGAADAITQASVLNLYDPDRSQSVSYLDRIASWESFTGALGAAMSAQSGKQGAGLRLLTGPITGPTEAALLAQVLADYPRATWHRWDPLGADHARRGLVAAFGTPHAARYDLERADVVVALDADFLYAGLGAVRHARDFAARRRVDAASTSMNRLYVAESTPSPTGSVADHRLAVRPSVLPVLAVALAAKVGVPGVSAPSMLDAKAERFVTAAARDLAAHRGRSLVLAGEPLPAAAHALVAAINDALGNAGETVTYSEPVEADPVDGADSLATLVAALRADEVDLLIVSGVNPVYDAPADLDFAAAINRDRTLRIHHGLWADETAELCQWHVPATHELESWGDARAFDGTVTLIQPLIEPLYGGKSASELWAGLLGRPAATGYDLLQEHWQQTDLAAVSFEDAFRQALHDGVVAGSALPAVAPALALDAGAAAARELAGTVPASGFELALRPDPTILDGRFANNGWLQELPKPITKLTWDNALMLAPRTAEQLGVFNEDLVTITVDGRSVTAPAWILPGQPEGVGTLHLGYGRRRAGRVADGVGVAASGLQTVARRWNLAGVDFARDRRSAGARLHPGPLLDRGLARGRDRRGGETAGRAHGDLRRVPCQPGIRERRRARGRRPRSLAHARVRLQPGQRLGDDHRPVGLQWLQRLHGGLPVREQHSGDRQGRGAPRARDALDSRRPLLSRGSRRARGDHQPADPLHAVRAGAVRGRLSGRRHRPLGRRPQRHGVQPLRRHPLLPEQLPLQGAAVQLLALPGLGDTAAQAPAQP